MTRSVGALKCISLFGYYSSFQLPLDYTWQIVRDRVQQFGPVDHAEMIAPGCAKVSFASSSDAERARKALQNTTVEGRLIGVEFLA